MKLNCYPIEKALISKSLRLITKVMNKSAPDYVVNKLESLFLSIMYSGVGCACGVTLSVYPHRAS